jgi:hypothetical protein
MQSERLALVAVVEIEEIEGEDRPGELGDADHRLSPASEGYWH